MPYATAADMRARYPERDLREVSDANAELVDDTALERALDDASAEIDAYLLGRYPLPLASAPTVLVQHCCAIAMYGLMRNAPEAALKDPKDRRDAAIRYLEQVASGKVTLGLAPTSSGVPAPPVESGVVVLEGPARTFSRDRMRGY